MTKLESLNSDLFRPLTASEIQLVAGAGSTTAGGTSSSTVGYTYSSGVEVDNASDSNPDGGVDWDF